MKYNAKLKCTVCCQYIQRPERKKKIKIEKEITELILKKMNKL